MFDHLKQNFTNIVVRIFVADKPQEVRFNRVTTVRV